MSKRSIFFILILIILIFSGCGTSSHADELADYYNSYADTINPLAEEIDEQTEKLDMIEDDQEAMEFHKENIIPLVKEAENFITSADPESDVVQELHDLRVGQLDAWFEAFELRTEAFEAAMEEDGGAEVNKLVQQSEAKFFEASQHAALADEHFLELASEHDVKLVEEEE